MGIPLGAVRNALKKEGKDTNIVDMDPEKSYTSHIKGKDGSDEKDNGPPLKDDPEYAKFFKVSVSGACHVDLPLLSCGLIQHSSLFFTLQMLKMGIPMGAVQNALKKEGKDTNIINLDPEKSLASQQPSKATKEAQKPTKPKGPKVARKRLHWNKIDESKLSANSFWNQAKGESLQLEGLDFDNEEFASLFTSEVGKKPAKKEETKKPLSSKQKVQLIDGRRRMNGSILLSKFKVDYKVLARQVDNMEYIEAEGNELRGMMQLLPTKDESLALRSYLPPLDAPQAEIEESIAKLGECEQYMAIMLDVPGVKGKFESMVFRAEFEGHADSIRDGTKMLLQACDAVKNSERFRKLLLYALKLGNALNTGGSNEEVSAITLDSLLKLAEAKAFDRQTSVLHYLVSIVQKNDGDVLKLAEDFVPVKAAERVAMDMLALLLKEMDKGLQLLKDVVLRNLPPEEEPPAQTDGTNQEEDDEFFDAVDEEEVKSEEAKPANPRAALMSSMMNKRGGKEKADKVADDALSWITPTYPSANPKAWRNQSTITVSTSVAAGDVCHNMHCAAIVLTSISASIDGGAALAGKYAKKRGCCQWVIPGITIASKSSIIASIDSPPSGGEFGNCAAVSPNAVCARTGRSPRVL